jgi:hypothetical protein
MTIGTGLRHALAAAAVAICSGLLSGLTMAAPAPRPDEGQIAAAAATVLERGVDERVRRPLPLFFHVEGTLWLQPLPVYATAGLLKLAPSAPFHARWAAVAWGALDALLIYVLAARWFQQPAVGLAAALVLVITPSHALFSRIATPEGIWPIPFILGWAIGLTAFAQRPSTRGRWLLAAGMGSLAASAYTQPSAALAMPMYAVATLIAFRAADGWRIRDGSPAAASMVAVLLPLLLWYARHPGTYPDTWGRWVLHAAHLRNPVVWYQSLANWHRLGNVFGLFSDFFAPSHLFLTPGAPGLCGMFLSPAVVPISVGVYAAIRRTDRHDAPRAIPAVLVAGCLIGPLAAAMFEQARSDDRALTIVPFGVLTAVWGATVMWRHGGVLGRGVLLVLSVVAAVQALVCFNRV